MEEEEYRFKVAVGDYNTAASSNEISQGKPKRFKKSEYFSDEEEEEVT